MRLKCGTRRRRLKLWIWYCQLSLIENALLLVIYYVLDAYVRDMVTG